MALRSVNKSIMDTESEISVAETTVGRAVRSVSQPLPSVIHNEPPAPAGRAARLSYPQITTRPNRLTARNLEGLQRNSSPAHSEDQSIQGLDLMGLRLEVHR